MAALRRILGDSRRRGDGAILIEALVQKRGVADWANFTDYLAQVQAYERVRLNREPGADGFDGPAYFREHFYLLDARTEMFIGQAYNRTDRVLQLLLLPRNEVSGDEDQADASRFVHDVLSRSSCCKFSTTAHIPLVEI